MRFFEDVTVGERREIGSHTFTADEIKTFARKFDPQPFHVDEEAGARSHFGGLCASGWHTAAVCMRYIVLANQREDAEMRARDEPVAISGPSPGTRDVRWIKPVYPGDTIAFAVETKDKRETSRPSHGLVFSHSTGVNQHGELVYSASGAVFVERRSK